MAEAAGAAIKAAAWRVNQDGTAINAAAVKVNKDGAIIGTVTTKVKGDGKAAKTHLSLDTNAAPLTCNKDKVHGKAALTAAITKHLTGNPTINGNPRPLDPRMTASYPRQRLNPSHCTNLSDPSHPFYDVGPRWSPSHQQTGQIPKRNHRSSNIRRRMN